MVRADGERVLLACLSASFLPDGTVWGLYALGNVPSAPSWRIVRLRHAAAARGPPLRVCAARDRGTARQHAQGGGGHRPPTHGHGQPAVRPLPRALRRPAVSGARPPPPPSPPPSPPTPPTPHRHTITTRCGWCWRPQHCARWRRRRAWWRTRCRWRWTTFTLCDLGGRPRWWPATARLGTLQSPRTSSATPACTMRQARRWRRRWQARSRVWVAGNPNPDLSPDRNPWQARSRRRRQ